MIIPEILNNYNVYDGSNKLVGTDAKVDLPDLKEATESVSGAGMFGTVDVPAVGHFDQMTMKISFNCLSKQYFDIAKKNGNAVLTLRGGIQKEDLSSGALGYDGLKIVVKGRPTTLSLGSAEAGKKMGSSIELSLSYIKIVMGTTTVIEIDKFNGKYVVNGTDMLASLKKLM